VREVRAAEGGIGMTGRGGGMTGIGVVAVTVIETETETEIETEIGAAKTAGVIDEERTDPRIRARRAHRRRPLRPRILPTDNPSNASRSEFSKPYLALCLLLTCFLLFPIVCIVFSRLKMANLKQIYGTKSKATKAVGGDFER
jgi:phage tail tape-measure protein